jgi:hypothetical protein
MKSQGDMDQCETRIGRAKGRYYAADPTTFRKNVISRLRFEL